MNEARWCKVLVVEDEPPILNHVVRKVESLALPVQVCATACDGAQACALVEQMAPDIVITDIRMPGMDGLALSRWLFEHYPAVKIVILSGYGEFEYAQAAIQYQVADYLLKPVNAQKLADTLERLCREIGSRNRVMQRQYLAKQLAGAPQRGGLPCQFEAEQFGLHLICLGNLLDECEPADLERLHTLWETAQLESALDTLPFPCWWVVEEKSPNERMVLTVGHVAEAAPTIYQHLQTVLKGEGSVTLCSAAAPVPFGNIWPIAKAMRAALHERLTPCQSACFTPQTPFAAPTCDAIHSMLAASLQGRQAGAFRTAVRTALAALVAQHATQQQWQETVVAVMRVAIQQGCAQEDALTQLYQTCCCRIAFAIHTDDVCAAVEQALTEAFRCANGDSACPEELAETVKTYLEQHYRSEITLEQLSKQFHFSDSYITRLFRARFGAPPMKYLLRLRMEKAKQLIDQNSDMSLATVAQLVGYADPHYFSRLFRLSTGVSPSAYRQR